MALREVTSLRESAVFDCQPFLRECCAIGDWWLRYAVDRSNGGFYGEVDYRNQPNPQANKSIILNARVLWFFSAVAKFTGRKDYADAAASSFAYIAEKFVDREHGGVLWMLTPQGEVVDGRKHTYAQAFAIYAFSAYYDLTGNEQALALALACFELIEKHAKDQQFNGYWEGFSQAWEVTDDVRLSAKEDQSTKTMNTHLHVLEAYTGLHNSLLGKHERAGVVAAALANGLEVYCEHIVDLDSGHVRMFMNEQWQDHSAAHSFGHDIESSWLIQKAMQSLESAGYSVSHFQVYVDRLAEVSLCEGLRENGCMIDERNIATGHAEPTAWWVQVEAMVGFANAWAHGGDEEYLQAVKRVWQYVQEHYIDTEHGEWHWFAKYDVAPADSEYKVGPWKAPYHSGRGMMQVYQLLSQRTEHNHS